jgi:hypothetical protein
MKRESLKTVVPVLVLTILATAWLARTSKSLAQNTSALSFPTGKWTFSAHPYMGEGFKMRPVVVTSVASNANTLSVTAVRLNNISSKPVRAVKLGWTLSEEGGGKVLKSGETSLIPLDSALGVASNRIVKAQVISFLEIYKPLLKNGRLDGNFRLDVGAIDVLFDDQSAWHLGDRVGMGATNLERVTSVVYSKDASPITVTPLELPMACAHQKCAFDGTPPPSYSCGGSDNEEFCTNCGVSCCNTICGQQPSCDCT